MGFDERAEELAVVDLVCEQDVGARNVSDAQRKEWQPVIEIEGITNAARYGVLRVELGNRHDVDRRCIVIDLEHVVREEVVAENPDHFDVTRPLKVERLGANRHIRFGQWPDGAGRDRGLERKHDVCVAAIDMPVRRQPELLGDAFVDDVLVYRGIEQHVQAAAVDRHAHDDRAVVVHLCRNAQLHARRWIPRSAGRLQELRAIDGRADLHGRAHVVVVQLARIPVVVNVPCGSEAAGRAEIVVQAHDPAVIARHPLDAAYEPGGNVVEYPLGVPVLLPLHAHDVRGISALRHSGDARVVLRIGGVLVDALGEERQVIRGRRGRNEAVIVAVPSLAVALSVLFDEGPADDPRVVIHSGAFQVLGSGHAAVGESPILDDRVGPHGRSDGSHVRGENLGEMLAGGDEASRWRVERVAGFRRPGLHGRCEQKCRNRRAHERSAHGPTPRNASMKR